MSEYRIFSRNPDLTKNLEITDFKTLELVSRWCRSGSWNMKGEGLCPFDPSKGIIVEKDGVQIFSGIVRKIEKEMTADQFISRA